MAAPIPIMVKVPHSREQLRTTFDSAADLYQQARPDYPKLLYDTLVATTGIGTGARLLEVGCATGKATAPLARRGFHITCIEIGPALASAARRNLAPFPEVTLIDGAFESWAPDDAGGFDLILLPRLGTDSSRALVNAPAICVDSARPDGASIPCAPIACNAVNCAARLISGVLLRIK